MTTAYPPGPSFAWKPLKLLRFARDFTRAPLDVLTDMFQQYGPVVHFHFGGKRRFYALADPEMIHDILIHRGAHLHKSSEVKDRRFGVARFLGDGLFSSDGELWKRQRKLIQPALHAQRIASYAGTMVSMAEDMAENWQSGETYAIHQQMMQVTLRIVTKSLFGVDSQAQAERIGQAMGIFQDMLTLRNGLSGRMPAAQRRVQAALDDIDSTVYEYIRQRRESDVDNGDLLSMLVNMIDESDDTAMIDRQIRDEAMTIMLAGHETTANALNWIWYLLSQHPDVEAKLHTELDEVLGERLPTLDDLEQLVYTEMVVKESMRLYPPSWSFGRQVIESFESCGYTIPEGSDVRVLIYHLHHSPDLWEDPEKFNPERFNARNEPSIPRYAYLPFGGGPRICIGNSFASMEARLILATVARRYTLHLIPGQQIVPDPQITLRPRYGLHMRVEAR